MIEEDDLGERRCDQCNYVVMLPSELKSGALVWRCPNCLQMALG